tara:strand:+ start:531 stop:944 length:414 start_codon:yes stop_codon:yes gene_type:complete
MSGIDLAEYAKEAESNGMTKRLRVGEYGIARNGLIIVRYEGGAWGGNNCYEAHPPIGYSWEGCSGGGCHGWLESTLAKAREYNPADAERCLDSYSYGPHRERGRCLWADWIYEPEKHHPIELMSLYSIIGIFNPFFS